MLRGDGLRNLAFIDQLLIQAAGLAVAQYAGCHIQFGIVRLEHSRCVPADVHTSELNPIVNLHALFFRQYRLRHHHRWYRCPRFQRAKVLLHEFLGLPGVEVTGKHQGCIVGPVVGSGKGFDIVQFDGLNVGM